MNMHPTKRRRGAFAVLAVSAIAAAIDVVFNGRADGAGLLLLANAPAAVELEAVKGALDKIKAEVKSFAETALGRVEKGEQLSATIKSDIDKALTEQQSLIVRMQGVEQKLSEELDAYRTTKGDKSTPGELLVKSDEFKAWVSKGGYKARGAVMVSMKAITSLDASAGQLVNPDRTGVMVTQPQRRMTVRDLITPGTTESNLVEFVRETGYTNNAATVAEGALKPQSDLTFEKDSAKVVTIAHWVPASNQILADAPMLQSYIDGRMRYGLAFAEEAQLLRGSGAADNIHGIIPQAEAYAAPITIADATHIDVLRLALLQSELAEYPATGIVLHPANWAAIELTKTEDGAYIFANPQSIAGAVLWGRPVVQTQAMQLDEFLVGAFRLGAQVFDREEAAVVISTEDVDNFRKNMVTIRAEERLAMVVYRPEAFVTGDLPAAAP